MTLWARRHVVSVTGLENVAPENDPFILVSNHATRREAIFLPPLLTLQRNGNLVHFMGDWNFRLVPGLNLLYWRSKAITVSRKPVPIWPFDKLRPVYRDRMGAFRRAESYLREGRSVAIFPEGTVNRDPDRLLKGHPGAAWLSLRTGAPVLPVGIVPVFAESGRFRGIDIRFGEAVAFEAGAGARKDLRGRHAAIMRMVSMLCDKEWESGEGEGAQDHAAR